jgi:hypothetical protein
MLGAWSGVGIAVDGKRGRGGCDSSRLAAVYIENEGEKVAGLMGLYVVGIGCYCSSVS